MKLLFDLDGHDYEPDWKRYVRNSSRGIIIRNGLIGMVHSTKFDYYKFPGGGIEKGESRVEALIREVAEEAGLVVLRSTIRPYGYVHRIQKSNKGGIFVQDNYYYFCKTARTPCSRHLDEYEKKRVSPFRSSIRVLPFRQIAKSRTAQRTERCWNVRQPCWSCL